jgi:2-methylaconitate cis-trans-isomerase PrpF/tripartite-type tricarboxylate transporter receptor subunit TctC
MRAGTSRGPFFLREWLPGDEAARDEALIGAIGASDLLQLDGVGGGSTLTSKVAIVSRSSEPGCDVDYLFAQVGVGQRSVDTRPNCGNMLAGVGPFAIEQGLVVASDGTTTVRVFNVNTRSRIDVSVQTPGGRVTYAGDTRIDGVGGTAAPIRLNFLDAWGAVTGSVFPTGQRIDVIDGTELTCIDAAMPLMIVRAQDLGVSGRESPSELDTNTKLLERLESLRRTAGLRMGLGDVSASVVPKPVLVSEGDSPASLTSRYFTPWRCHASHAATGAIGVATAFALPGTVASASQPICGTQGIAVLHPQGRIDVEVEIAGVGNAAQVQRAALVRTARKILQGELHLPDYVFSQPVGTESQTNALITSSSVAAPTAATFPARTITIVVPTTAGGANDAMARAIAQRLGPLLGQTVIVDNRAGANGSIAAEYVARAVPDGHTLMLGYIATHGMNPALQDLRYDPVTDFEPVGMVGYSPTLMVAGVGVRVQDVTDVVTQLKARLHDYAYASAGNGTAPHFAAELFKLSAGVAMPGVRYKGSAPAITATIGGQTQFMFPSLFTAYPHVRAGRLRALAVAGPTRVTSLPDVPTLHEAGVDGVDVTQWYAIFAPSGTSAAVVERINSALNQVLADKDVMRRMEEHGAHVQLSTPGELGTLVRAELAKWTRVVEKAKLTADRAWHGSPDLAVDLLASL